MQLINLKMWWFCCTLPCKHRCDEKIGSCRTIGPKIMTCQRKRDSENPERLKPDCVSACDIRCVTFVRTLLKHFFRLIYLICFFLLLQINTSTHIHEMHARHVSPELSTWFENRINSIRYEEQQKKIYYSIRLRFVIVDVWKKFHEQITVSKMHSVSWLLLNNFKLNSEVDWNDSKSIERISDHNKRSGCDTVSIELPNFYRPAQSHSFFSLSWHKMQLNKKKNNNEFLLFQVQKNGENKNRMIQLEQS